MPKEGFEDIDYIIQGQKGIFGDECAGLCGDSAMTAFSQAPRTTTAQGVIYDIRCENGDSMIKYLVEWPEFVALKAGISPHFPFQGATDWGFNQEEQSWFPNLRCTRCGWPFRLMISPNEVEGNLRSAVSKGQLPEPQYQQLLQHCMAARQRMGR